MKKKLTFFIKMYGCHACFDIDALKVFNYLFL